jgi:hypothetical protein
VQLIDVVDDLAEVVPTLDFVFDLSKNLTNFVLDRIRPAGLLLEAMQVGKSFRVTNSRRSSPVRALLWSIWPSLPLGAAQLSQR